MAAINNFTIVGNVTRDPVLRQLPSKAATVTYVVAVNNTWHDKEGNKHEECDFIPVTTYGKQAENDAKFLKKGSCVAVTGHIRSWYKQVEKKGGFNFEATSIQYLGKPSGAAANEDTPQNAQGGLSGQPDEWLDQYNQHSQQ